MRGAIPPLPSTSSWRGAWLRTGTFYLYLYLYLYPSSQPVSVRSILILSSHIFLSLPSSTEVKEWVELYLHFPNTSWHGAQLKHRDTFTFYFTFTFQEFSCQNSVCVPHSDYMPNPSYSRVVTIPGDPHDPRNSWFCNSLHSLLSLSVRSLNNFLRISFSDTCSLCFPYTDGKIIVFRQRLFSLLVIASRLVLCQPSLLFNG
jgi:hypothetical protein